MERSRAKRSILDDLVDEEPELHHYTTLDGLKGILQSNSLWATHFRHTNDTSEFTLLHTLLIKRIAALLTPLLSETYRVNQSFRDLAHGTSGTFEAFVNDHALGVVDAMYDQDIGDPIRGNFAKPAEDGAFMTCFCAHNKDSEFVKKNGLLSQWRGYTGSTKFCLVFDTKELVRLARIEADRHLWRFMTFDRACYAEEELPAEENFDAVALWCARTVLEAMAADKFVGHSFDETDAAKILARLGLFDTVLSCATKIKHLGFSEEREIRMVAFRAGPLTMNKARSLNQPIRNAKPKALRSRNREGVTIPYIAFFDELGERLPIKQIIVGPSRNQQKHNLMLREFVPANIPIVNSIIPFVG